MLTHFIDVFAHVERNPDKDDTEEKKEEGHHAHRSHNSFPVCVTGVIFIKAVNDWEKNREREGEIIMSTEQM